MGAPEKNEQLKQARQNMAENAAQLKKQITSIQQQSIQKLRESIQSVFIKNNEANLQQITQQQGEMLNDSAKTDTPANSAMVDAGKEAMGIADKGVEQAMKSAMQGFSEVKKLMNSLKRQKRSKQ